VMSFMTQLEDPENGIIDLFFLNGRNKSDLIR